MNKLGKQMQKVANLQKAQQMNSDPGKVKAEEIKKKEINKEQMAWDRKNTKRLLETQIFSHEHELAYRREQVKTGEVLEADEKYVNKVKPVWLIEAHIKYQEHELEQAKDQLKALNELIEKAKKEEND